MFKLLKRAAFTLALGVTALTAYTQAQAQALPVPNGSYRQTCAQPLVQPISNTKILGLTARCLPMGGPAKQTQLILDNALQNKFGDIANCNGDLRYGRCTPPTLPPAPRGSYQQSCSPFQIQAGGTDGSVTLSAVCRALSGQMELTSLVLPATGVPGGQDVANCNGALTVGACVPQGSYQQTCQSASMQGTTLIATCRKLDGSMMNTSLANAKSANSDIANCDGSLTVGPCYPTGSYQQTCANISYAGGKLSALCRRIDGSNASTALDGLPLRPAQDVANCNGVLTLGSCIPHGSYQQSCNSIALTGSTLTAQCRKMDGSLVPASLANYPSAGSQDIANCNGTLTIGGCGAPQGSYQRTCNGISMQGATLNASCQRMDGSWTPASLPNAMGYNKGDIANCNGQLKFGGC